MKKNITIAVIVLLALGFGYYLFTISPQEQVRPGAETFDLSKVQQLQEPRGLGDDDHVLGNREAKNTLVIYEDFQCPACAGYAPTVKQFTSELRDTKVVFRHFPLLQIHSNAAAAGYASEAAAAQGKFWEMHDKLYGQQAEWSNAADPTEKFVELAQAAGVGNIEKFRQDLQSKTFKPRVEKDYLEAMGLRLTGTPTVMFNGTKIDSKQYNLEALKVAVEPLYK